MNQHLAAGFAAATGNPGPFNNIAIQGLFIFFGSLVLMLVGIKLFLKSDSGDVRKASNTGVVVIIGAVIFSLGLAGAWVGVGSGAFGVLFNS